MEEEKKCFKPYRFLIFFVFIAYEEILFQLFVFGQFSWGTLYGILFALPAAALLTLLTGVWVKKVNTVMTCLMMFLVLVLVNAQIIYYDIFKTFMQVYSVGHGAGNALEFIQVVIQSILRHVWWKMLLTFVPFVLYYAVPWLRHHRDDVPLSWKQSLAYLGAAVVLHLVCLAALLIPGKGIGTPYDLYHTHPALVSNYRNLGVITAFRTEAQRILTGKTSTSGGLDIITTSQPDSRQEASAITENSGSETSSGNNSSYTESRTEESAQVSSPDNSSGNVSGPTEESSQAPEPVLPIVEPFILDIDFDKLIEEAPNQTIADMHRYFQSQTPSYTNQYTGMFEGYNLIWIVAESFSFPVIDEVRTPTLYKMANSSFVFNNFYTAYFHVSTSDGEYTTLNSLVPKDDVWSFYRSSMIEMPFGFGNIMTPLGYTCRGYHNHDYDYYDRNLSHPNWGLIWKGLGNGLQVDRTWPESDLQLMELTIPEYINDDHFMTYYLTVSGHAPYNYGGDAMASRHREITENMDVSTDIKCYLAANMEVEYAMEYLLNALEEAGVADHTVIVLTADHYPYGLSDEDLTTLYGYDVTNDFDRYRNTCIMYCPGMEETVVVDKPGSNLDVAVTLANLFNLPYDSRLVSGTDLLSDSEGIVIFGDRSFLTDKVIYTSTTNTVKVLDENIPEGYVENLIAEVRNKFTISAAILDNNYFSYLKEYLPWWNGESYGHLWDPSVDDPAPAE